MAWRYGLAIASHTFILPFSKEVVEQFYVSRASCSQGKSWRCKTNPLFFLLSLPAPYCVSFSPSPPPLPPPPPSLLNLSIFLHFGALPIQPHRDHRAAECWHQDIIHLCVTRVWILSKEKKHKKAQVSELRWHLVPSKATAQLCRVAKC